MRNKFWNRVLVALSGLFIFAAGVLLFLVSFLSLFSISLSLGGTELSQLLNGLAVWQKILLMLGGVAVAALGLHDLSIPFPSRRERGFIMQHTELGDMSISMNALDTMVRHCVDQHKELTVKSTRISRVKSGIVVEIRIMLAAGVNIPLTVNALQKQVKQYIMSCSGVEVYEVKVLVETGIPNGKVHHGQELVLEPQTAAQPVKTEASIETAGAEGCCGERAGAGSHRRRGSPCGHGGRNRRRRPLGRNAGKRRRDRKPAGRDPFGQRGIRSGSHGRE